MAQEHRDRLEFTGFGGRGIPEMQAEDGVFILAVYRDGELTAAAHDTETGAMEAAASYLLEETAEDDHDGTREDRYTRAQRIIADEGGRMEIIPSAIFRRDE